MAILSRTAANRLYWAAAVFAFVCGGSVGVYGVSLLVAAALGHGSGASDILIFGLGVFLLLISTIMIIFGVVACKTSKSMSGKYD